MTESRSKAATPSFMRPQPSAAPSISPLPSFLTAVLLTTALLTTMAQSGRAQAGGPYERTFHQSKSTVEKLLKELQPAMSGRLPVLDGFVLPGDHPLNRYQRAYYQASVEVSATRTGESIVRASAKVTAWYADSTRSHSGYQLLTSNGRLESDLLDQLTDLLKSQPNAASSRERSGEPSGGNSSKGSTRSDPAPNPSTTSATQTGMGGKRSEESAISAPVPLFRRIRLPNLGGSFHPP